MRTTVTRKQARTGRAVTAVKYTYRPMQCLT